MATNRQHLISEINNRPKAIPVDTETDFGRLYASQVFGTKEMRQRLPKSVFKRFEECIHQNKPLDVAIADVIASSMKDWAIEQGATHYSHWFQPMTGSTAEKHDTFIQPTSEGLLIMGFSGKELIQGEPDASSFPSGGLRATFEARGYTAWDPTSPAFIKKNRFGATLFIPTAFCSYTGEALDMKTPLLRSKVVLSNAATRLLKLMGEQVTHVISTSGLEQEYFLIDKAFYAQRPDLIACGRTLFGKMPYKGQELEDHYFGAIRSRVLNFMMEAEQELYRLGIPVKTRHNEVAPGQYEIAPTFEEANLASDHNLLIMETMAHVAERHNLKALFHEKPFAEVNGSGKHCNWSMSDSNGSNLLDPGATPSDNIKFMVFLSAVIRAVHKYSKLLRVSVAHAGNDHRLGANEAPPAIISIFLGSTLEDIVNSIVDGRSASAVKQVDMELGVATLPKFPKDNSDRNRTSPFAFTGNKFEFRALGSSQSGSVPNYFLNTIAAESIDYIADQLESKLKKKVEVKTALNQIIKDVLTQHRAVIFNGNGYSKEWEKEAAKRGLPNLKTTVDAIDHFDDPEHVKLFEKYKILSKAEINSRKHVRIEKYIKTIEIEVRACLDIVSTIIIPAVIDYKFKLATVVEKIGRILDEKNTIEKNELKVATQLLRKLYEAKNTLEKLYASMPEAEMKKATYIRDKVIPAMNEVRKYADSLEGIVDDACWPLPKYREMLSIL